MGKFRYRMQSILNIKVKLEEQEKNTFAVRNKELSDEEEKLSNLNDALQKLEQSGKELLLSDKLCIFKIEENKKMIKFMNERIRAQGIQVRMAKKKVEEQRRVMINAIQDRKTQDILRENAFQQFVVEQNKEENKQIDELTSYRYGIGKKIDG